MKFTLLFGTLGYLAFIYNLESDGMGNILFRGNENNELEFRFDELWDYMTNPFKRWFLWHPRLWGCNWVITTGIGVVIGLTIDCITSVF